MTSHNNDLETSSLTNVPSPPWRPLPLERFLIGICHFPEQEPRGRLREDARLMAEAGIEVVRLGEFAWSVLEPAEGLFDFDLFDEAIAILGEHGIDTIFCTPTATPPRWLTHRHPEVLRRDRDGREMQHGSRQHADAAHPVFREQSRRITKALADHYRDNPYLIGWQTDNEINTHFSETHSDAAQTAFRTWLKGRYRDIDALNSAWGTVFWNRQYGSFDEIQTPIDQRPAAADPSHMLDYRRFLAALARDFQFEQVQILRAVQPSWFVFHNVGRLNDTDLHAFGNDLSFLGVDVYPGLRDEIFKFDLGYAQAMHLDMFRGWTGNFIIPEMQLGGGAHPGMAIPALEPGELRRFAMSAVARGADGILWFRWTTARFGAEMYWMGALDHDRVPRRRLSELTAAIAELKAMRADVLGTTVDMDVAILSADWENEIAHSTLSLGLPGLSELSAPLHLHCYGRNVRCGFAAPGDDLSRVRVAFVPHLPVWHSDWTDRLQRFVEQGGTLVVGARTATRDRNNHALESAVPGGLTDLCGVEVVETGRLPAAGAGSTLSAPVFQVEDGASGRKSASAQRSYNLEINGASVRAALGYELLQPKPGVKVIGQWSSRFLDGAAAITRRDLGRGSVIYVGTFLTHDLVSKLFVPLFEELDVQPIITAPPGVEASTRSAADRALLFVQNTTSNQVEVLTAAGSIKLGPYDCTMRVYRPNPSRERTSAKHDVTQGREGAS